MSKRYTIVKTTLLLVSALVAFFIVGINTKKVSAYSCPSNYHCSVYGSIASGWRKWYDSSSKSYYCSSGTWSYSCSGTDSSCSGGFTYYTSSSDCNNDTNSYFAGCCDYGPSCTCSDCTPPACPSGTSESGSYGFYTQTDCSRGDCGDCGSSTRNCYCTSACTPTACPSSYSTTDKGVGIAVTYSCVNACNNSSSRNCYYYACNDCNLTCPDPNLFTSPTTSYPVTTTTCTRGGDCRGSAKTGTCYENSSPKPTGSITLNSPAGGATTLGFTSTNTSGTNANEPLSVSASFSDVNGASTIEAVSFWFQTATTTPSTPSYIAATGSPKTYTKNSWGFMLHKEGTDWIPYIPSQNGTADKWVKAVFLNGIFSIMGPANPTSKPMVQVYMPTPPTVTSAVNVSFTLNFVPGEPRDLVTTGNYNVFTMAHDTFGFTPSDNYAPIINTNFADGQIRYPSDWVDSSKDWYIDLNNPTINPISITVYNEDLVVNWNVSDAEGIYGVVGNIYEFGLDATINPLLISIGGVSQPQYTPTEEPADANLIGHLSQNRAFFVPYYSGTPVTYPTTRTGSARIDLNGNKSGSLTIYITAFDRGGNRINSSEVFALGDWMVSRGGFVYSSEGIDMNVRDLNSDAWTSTPLLTGAGFLPQYVDITSEMLATSNPTLSYILKYKEQSKTYGVAGLSVDDETNFYTDYKNAFDQKRGGKGGGLPSGFQEYNESTKFATGTSMCTGAYTDGCLKYGEYPGDITVGSNFECNGKGVFFVEGNLTINPNITNNSSNKDACIFFVKQNVTIGSGGDLSSGGNTAYDQVNAFILAGGTVTISFDDYLDGLLLKGGIFSPNNKIVMGRKILLKDKNTFPALAVANHAKYGVFAKELFGSKIDLAKTEVGFKPY